MGAALQHRQVRLLVDAWSHGMAKATGSAASSLRARSMGNELSGRLRMPCLVSTFLPISSTPVDLLVGSETLKFSHIQEVVVSANA